MSNSCKITGLSEKQALRWNYYHQTLIGEEIDYDKTELTTEYFDNLSSQIKSKIEDTKLNKKDIDARKKLLAHLKKNIASRIKGAKLIKFGSSVSGLSLKHGDLDLCLKVKTENPKKTLNYVSRMLKQQNMDDVQLISRAKVPVVKFFDSRSLTPVDISINNTLAVNNSELMKHYADSDPRVKELILAVKDWASSRDLNDAFKGTFSSYTWSILVIQFLQLLEEPVLPNLQDSEDRDLQIIDGIEYDVTINQDKIKSFKSKNSSSTGELFCQFFEFYALGWNWDKEVVSIRSGAPISRDEKGWLASGKSALQILVSEEKARLGAHRLAIEDPFDLSRDLSSVLRAEGLFDIKNELLRALSLISKNDNYSSICELKSPDKFSIFERKDIFEDLRNVERHVLENKKQSLETELKSVEKRVESARNERSQALKMSKAVKGVIEATSEMSKEAKEVVALLKQGAKNLEQKRNARDEINQRILLPLHSIEEQLSHYYEQLTGEVDIFRVPSLEKEMSDFRYFFELKQMHGEMKKSQKLHEEYVSLVKEQRSNVKKLEKIDKDKSDTASKLLEEDASGDLKINIGDLKEYNRKIAKLNKILDEIFAERRTLRREVGRLDAWFKILDKPKPKPRRKHNDRNRDFKPNKPSAFEVRKKSEAGGTLDLSELDVLLSSGGLVSSSSKNSSKSRKRMSSSKKSGSKRLQNISAHRGQRNTKSRKKEE